MGITRQRIAEAAIDHERVAYTVGIILVRFDDTNYESNYQNNSELNWPEDPFAQVLETFNSETYHGSNAHPVIYPPSEGWGEQIVFGSFRDYWLESTFGIIDVTAEMVNQSGQWIVLPGNGSSYGAWPVCSAAIAAAVDRGWITLVQGNPAGYIDHFDQIIVISLPYWDPTHGHALSGPQYGPWGAAYPNHPFNYGGNHYHVNVTPGSMVHDGFFRTDSAETDMDWFHIGYYCHEYGHLLGLWYSGSFGGGNSDAGCYALMACGSIVGERFRGECPPRLRAPSWYSLEILDYLEANNLGGIEDITSDMDNINIIAPTNNGITVYRRSFPSDDTFLIEAMDTDHHRSPSTAGTWDSWCLHGLGQENRNEPITDNNLMIWRFRDSIHYIQFIEAGYHEGDRNDFYTDWQGSTQDFWPGSPVNTAFTPFNIYHHFTGDISPDFHPGFVHTPMSRIGYGNNLLHSEFAILNIRGTNHNASVPEENKVTVNFRINWPWMITENDTLEAPFTLRDSIEIMYGGILTIVPSSYSGVDASVLCAAGKGIIVHEGGTLRIQGTPGRQIVFSPEVQGQPWYGIKISSHEDNQINSCDISGAAIGIRVIEGSAEISGCNIYGNMIGIGAVNNSDVVVNYCQIWDNSIGGCALHNDCNANFTESQIHNNARWGIQCSSYSNADLEFCSVTDNGDGTEVWQCGLKSICGTLDLYCSASCNNNGPGIVSVGSYVDLCFETVGQQTVSGANQIRDNIPSQMGWFPGQIFVDMTWQLGLNYGRNSIEDNEDVNRPLIIAWEDPATSGNWQHNYWGPFSEQQTLLRLPGNVNINPLDIGPTYCNPDAPPKSTPEDPAKLLFYQAWMEENLSQFETAILDYKQIIEDYPESPEAKMAVDRIVFCNKLLTWTWQEVRNYFLNLADTTSDLSMKITAKNAAAWCLVQMEQYEQARVEFIALIDMSQTTADSVKIAINQLMAELEASGLDTILTVPPPGLGREIPGVEALVASDRELRIILTADELLRSFNIGGSSSISKYSGVPEIYSLEQNYPNPFNSETVIRYGLPEAGHVEITVYNVLGQKVATLLDASQSAGFHKILWNGQSNNGQCLASGMYFYCIKANNFMNVKKMVLLR